MRIVGVTMWLIGVIKTHLLSPHDPPGIQLLHSDTAPLTEASPFGLLVQKEGKDP